MMQRIVCSLLGPPSLEEQKLLNLLGYFLIIIYLLKLLLDFSDVLELEFYIQELEVLVEVFY